MSKIESLHIEQLINGDTNSFEYFHRMYQSKVFHYSLKLIRNKEAAQEITSDVFMTIWKKRATLDKSFQSINGLLMRITRDLAINYLKKVAKDQELRKAYIAQYFEMTTNPIEELIYFKEDLEIAEQSIKMLPPKCQMVFKLKYFNGLSTRQIAEKLNISTNTVQNHISRGTSMVKDYLQANSDLIFMLLLAYLEQA